MNRTVINFTWGSEKEQLRIVINPPKPEARNGALWVLERRYITGTGEETWSLDQHFQVGVAAYAMSRAILKLAEGAIGVIDLGHFGE